MPVIPPIDGKSFSHITRHGFTVEADRCDLRGDVRLHVSADATDAQIAEAAAQAFGYHGANILPKLNAFLGYDAVRIEILRVNK